MAARLAVLPAPSVPWIDTQGRPTQAFTQFMAAVAAGHTGPYVSAANDAAAAASGVPIDTLYESGGFLKVRKI